MVDFVISASMECRHQSSSVLCVIDASFDDSQYAIPHFHQLSDSFADFSLIAIGLQYSFQTLQWLSTIPPILIVIAFKVYITRKFDNQFRYYIPSEDEIRLAQVHSERADSRQNRLEKRFGHPSLHTELFTPMLHAKMMPLLSQVYQGKMGRQEAKLDEYGGQKMEATVVEGGIKIAAINQVPFSFISMILQDSDPV